MAWPISSYTSHVVSGIDPEQLSFRHTVATCPFEKTQLTPLTPLLCGEQISPSESVRRSVIFWVGSSHVPYIFSLTLPSPFASLGRLLLSGLPAERRSFCFGRRR